MPKLPNLPSAPRADAASLPIELYWAGAPEQEGERAAIPFAHYLWVLRRHLWKIAALVLAAAVSVYVLTKRITPIYESTVTIGIDRQTPTGVVGQDATRAPGNDDEFLLTQVKLLQSDSVIRPVVEQLQLAPRQVLSAETRCVLPGLTVARVPGTYLLLASYRSPNPRLSAEVANAVAKSYSDYTYDTRYHATAKLSAFMERQLEELKAKTERSSAALSRFEQDLSMINPEQKTSIVSARLLQLNTDYGAAQGDRIAREAVWRSVQSGTLESLQVSNQGAALQSLADRIDDARQKLAGLQTHLGPKHPECIKAAMDVAALQKELDAARLNIARRVETEYRQSVAREQMLQKEFQQTKGEFDMLNSRSFQYSALKREADTDRALYDELERKIKEAGINADFQNNSINVADPARPSFTPVYPNTGGNVVEAFLIALVLGIGAALLSDKVDNTIRDPEQARSFLGAEVVATLPLVRAWRGKLVEAGRNGKPDHAAAAARFEEAVRTLRASILLANPQSPLKSVMITSVLPSEGKTTVAVQLAIAHAQQNNKTLLIDCDLRRPGVHAKLGVTPETGLAAALRNGLAWRDKLLRIENIPNLTVLPAGPSFEGCDALIGASLKHILAAAESEYDLVVVDSPPVLGFSEPLQMAAAAGGVVVVTVAGSTDRNAASQALASLRRLRVNLLGLVLNEVGPSTTDGYYADRDRRYYRYYRSETSAGGA
ncbi:MAG TPA: polysaccharide biosynthesis tyrosine autokinase [Bryobacteraceae bacterium]|jgi:capsular exopolysaccharide synthesis family protein|nr:polysaccharide biosynthesis tyrosine autokinase [Bryobacteraceae bacterium]